MTEQEWEKMERTMRFIIELQAESVGASAKVDQRLETIVEQQAKAEKRLGGLQRLGRQMMAAADHRFKQAETRLDRLEEDLSKLSKDISALVNSLRLSGRGNGEGTR